MDFEEFRLLSKKTDLFPPEGSSPDKLARLIEYRVLCLCGEVGELANKVKKIRRDDNSFITGTMQNAIIDEIGDILWYLATICSVLNVNMNLVAKKNLEKLEDRKLRNQLRGHDRDETHT